MRAGKVLRLERGLAEIEFDCGAPVILQGPAGLELLSGNAARLLQGTLTARVPARPGGSRLLPRTRSSTSAPSSACRSTTGGRRRSGSSRGRSWPSRSAPGQAGRSRAHDPPGPGRPARRPHRGLESRRQRGTPLGTSGPSSRRRSSTADAHASTSPRPARARSATPRAGASA